MRIKCSAYIFLALFALLPISQALALKKVSVELKWFHQFQFAGIYAAKEKGFYRDEGLDVTIVERDKNSSPLNDVLAGKVQFGVSDSTIILNKLQGNQVVILAAIFQHSPLILITREEDKILSPLELKGKRVMFQKDIDDAIIIGMFNEFGISKNEFIFVPHSFNHDSLIKGETDAISGYLGNQPFYYKERGLKVNIIKPENYGIDFYGDMLFTSEKYFKENKKTALAFRKASLLGWEYALAHPNEVITWIKKKYKSKNSRAALEYEAEVTKRMIAHDNIALGNIASSRLEHIASVYKKNYPQLNDKSINGLNYKLTLRTYLI